MESFKTLQKRAARIQNDDDTERYRTLSRRIGSGLVDSAILMIPMMLVVILLANISLAGKYLTVMALMQLLSITFNVFFVGLTGTTPGKWLFGLKVVAIENEEGEVGLAKASLRELLNGASLMLYLIMVITYSLQGRLAESDGIMNSGFTDLLWDIATVFGAIVSYSEVITALFSKKRRAIHDFIAKTVVVKSEIKNTLFAGAAVVAALGIYYLYFQTYNLLKS